MNNKYSQAINYFNKFKYGQSQKEPIWVSEFKQNKKSYISNGNTATGFGFRQFKGDFNMAKESASMNAKNALIRGIAEDKKLDSDKISATIKGAIPEYYFDQSVSPIVVYCKVTADISQIEF